MTSLVSRLAALAVLILGPSLASAQYMQPNCMPQIPQAPPGYGNGFYYSTCVTNYGPAYCMRPPFAPYGGVVPGPKPCASGNCASPAAGGPSGPMMGIPGGPGVMPSHPYARSPRDFFMVND